MPTRLVVNADDLGLHPDIDAGILRAHREGIVTSATVLVMGENAAPAVQAAKAQGLALGVHLALSTGVRCAAASESVPALAPGGRLRGSWAAFARAWLLGTIPRDEVAHELASQLRRANDLGFTPDHFDGHQHLHLLPGVRRCVEELAHRQHLPLRWPARWPERRAWRVSPPGALKSVLLWGLAALPDVPGRPRWHVRKVLGVGQEAAGALSEERLLALIDALPHGDVELGCHPGDAPLRVPEDPGWRYAWEEERDALCSPRVRDALIRRGVELSTYAALSSASNSPAMTRLSEI